MLLRILNFVIYVLYVFLIINGLWFSTYVESYKYPVCNVSTIRRILKKAFHAFFLAVILKYLLLFIGRSNTSFLLFIYGIYMMTYWKKFSAKSDKNPDRISFYFFRFIIIGSVFLTLNLNTVFALIWVIAFLTLLYHYEALCKLDFAELMVIIAESLILGIASKLMCYGIYPLLLVLYVQFAMSAIHYHIMIMVLHFLKIDEQQFLYDY